MTEKEFNTLPLENSCEHVLRNGNVLCRLSNREERYWIVALRGKIYEVERNLGKYQSLTRCGNLEKTHEYLIQSKENEIKECH